jgi:N-acetylglutamate synthase-like GNAT family acetyltransferase
MTSQPTDDALIRPARAADRAEILKLVQFFVDAGRLLPRCCDEIDHLIPCGFVAELKRAIVGFGALDVYSQKLAEIRSLAVVLELHHRGIGRQIIEACVRRARELGILEVMAISSSEDFFLSCGFAFTLPGEKKAFFCQTADN